MRYLVLACDFDGTLACHGVVAGPVRDALERCRTSGRRLVMVTGREIADLVQVFPELELFDCVVAENGGTLYDPKSRKEKPLAAAPPPEFLRRLESRGVAPLAAGRVVVATISPHETAVLQTIRELGLELQVIFNKGSVMVLPSGTNKATGLAAALAEMAVSPHNVVAVGDAENDHALLQFAEAGVAVANAVATLAEQADFVTAGGCGTGVVELIDRLLDSDLAELAPRLARHDIVIGNEPAGPEVRISPYGINVLVAGTSGSGKSTLATAIIERLIDRRYQVCIVDPEGDYEDFSGMVCEGSAQHAPDQGKALRALEDPRQNLVVSLRAVALADRPLFFNTLLTRLHELRTRSGHPHWIVIDEAHHMLPAELGPNSMPPRQHMDRLLFITLEEADLLAATALATVDTLIVLGHEPQKVLDRFAATAQVTIPPPPVESLNEGEALFWSRSAARPIVMQLARGTIERRRHARKYAEGDLGPDRSFYFRGPESKLNLRAQNLIVFMQIADGVDDDTWLFHLRKGEYSRWFRESIKDEELAAEAAVIEDRSADAPAEGRRAVKALIEQRYTLPGTATVREMSVERP